jgi:hypothetical protein
MKMKKSGGVYDGWKRGGVIIIHLQAPRSLDQQHLVSSVVCVIECDV